MTMHFFVRETHVPLINKSFVIDTVYCTDLAAAEKIGIKAIAKGLDVVIEAVPKEQLAFEFTQ